MNWTDEEIDKLFQESASQMNVPYQDAFWTEMETLLPQKEKKKGLGWIFGGTLTCIALIAAMIFPANHFSVQTAENKSVKNSDSQNTPDLNPGKTIVLLANNEEIIQSGNTFLTGNYREQKKPGQTYILSSQTIERNNIRENGKFSVKRSTESTDKMTVPGTLNQEENIDLTEDFKSSDPDQPAVEMRLPLLVPSSSPQQLASGSSIAVRPKNNHFYGQFGIGMSQSYIAGSDKNWIPALNFGAGYQYRPQGFGFSAGLNIHSSFSNNLEFTRRSKVYNFSSTNYEQNFKYRQLYSIEIPVSIDFRKNRNILSVGIAPTYLATTVMRFSQSENGIMSDNENYIGQKTGMNSFGLKPSLAYQLEISNSWSIGIQLSTQIIRQVDDTQFVGSYTKLPLNGQITIRKTIMR